MAEVSKSKVGAIVDAAASARLVVPAFNVPYLPMMAAISRTLSELDAFGLIQVARPEVLKFE
jgi:hypothetical protein